MLPKPTNELLHLARLFLRGIDCHRHDLGFGEIAEELKWKVQRLDCQISASAAAQNTKLLSTRRLAVSDKALKNWLTKARLVLMLAESSGSFRRGNDPAIAKLGTCTPRSREERVAHVRALVTFFARHPEFGVPFAEITAAKGRAVCDRVVQSGEMLRLAGEECLVVRQQRENGALELRRALQEILSLLQTQLNDLDSRWVDFGLAPKGRRRIQPRHSRGDLARSGVMVRVPERSYQAAAA